MPDGKKGGKKEIIKEEIKEEEKTWEETQKLTRKEEVILNQDDILLQWKAREYIHYEKHPLWYILGAIFSGILFLIAVFSLNFLFALIIIMASMIVYIYSKRLPQYLDVTITKTGVKINRRFFAYGDDLTSFWILYKPPELKTLHLETKGSLHLNLVVELEDMDPIKVREILLKYLPEDITQEEHAIDRFSRRIGF